MFWRRYRRGCKVDFRTDVFSLDVPHNSKFEFVGARLPSNLDVLFRAKHKELCEQYVTARLFMHKTETEGEEWEYWFNRLEDPKLQEIFELKIKSTLYESALMFYNIVVDLSWALCYICCEFACTVKGKRISIDGMKSIEEAYEILRSAERNVTSPTAENNPFDYLKKIAPEYIPAIDCITDFWRGFSDTPIRKTYNYCKHKGKPVYKELAAYQEPRFLGMYIQDNSGKKTQVSSDIRDVQMELSLVDEIIRLNEFDDEILFPYIQKLLQTIEDIIKPSPFLVT
jgi:hypothetical protein